MGVVHSYMYIKLMNSLLENNEVSYNQMGKTRNKEIFLSIAPEPLVKKNCVKHFIAINLSEKITTKLF